MEGILSRPFRSQENAVSIFVNGSSESRSFSLDDICSVGILGVPAESIDNSEREYLEDIELVTGERYRVRARLEQPLSNGFYCVPVTEGMPFRMLFLTFHGVKLKVQQCPLKIAQGSGNTLAGDGEGGTGLFAGACSIHNSIEQILQEREEYHRPQQAVRIGDILVTAGLVSRQQIDEALEIQKKQQKKRMGAILVERGVITEEQLLCALAAKFKLNFVDLEKVAPTAEALKKVPAAIATQLQVLPVSLHGKKLVVATSEPTDSTIVDRLQFITHCHIDLIVADSKKIKAAVVRHYTRSEDSVDALISEMGDGEPAIVDEREEALLVEPDSKVIRLVNKIMLDAYHKGASDIHFEPGLDRQPSVVRYRVDGECFIAHNIPNTYKSAIISRLKIISNLDIAERRKPQSGKIVLKYETRKLEYRLEITPTVGAQEDAVLRLLSASKAIPIHEMGFSPQNEEKFKNILAKPYGIILCVGPTGSGKTTTLHSGLAHINSPVRKIWTAEDPVEIVQEGLRQVQVNPKIGFTFQEALRSFLRADPDVVMIGEMRDADTAKTAINASLTGHLVLSTLHTNSAPETIVRLIEMGMDPFNFADAMLGILAQRLARRLCVKCAETYNPTCEEYGRLVEHYGIERFSEHGMPEHSELLQLKRRKGCDRCGGTGYKGRVAIHELLLGTPPVKEAIKTKAGVEVLRELGLHEGMKTLKMDGIAKVINGVTDLEQILKVCAV